MTALAKWVMPLVGHTIAKDEKKKAAAKYAPKPQQVGLPDEEQIKRTARRNAALRFGALGSGRASTILSNDKLGA
jgi:hypothetical protein